MLGTAPVIAFLGTADPDAATVFYRDTLGLCFVADTPFAAVFDIGGTELRIQNVPSVTPTPQTALGWAVDQIEAAVSGLAARGVNFERFDGLAQDALGIWTAPGGARVAWFRDPDGNLLSHTRRQ